MKTEMMPLKAARISGHSTRHRHFEEEEKPFFFKSRHAYFPSSSWTDGDKFLSKEKMTLMDVDRRARDEVDVVFEFILAWTSPSSPSRGPNQRNCFCGTNSGSDAEVCVSLFPRRLSIRTPCWLRVFYWSSRHGCPPSRPIRARRGRWKLSAYVCVGPTVSPSGPTLCTTSSVRKTKCLPSKKKKPSSSKITNYIAPSSMLWLKNAVNQTNEKSLKYLQE